MVKRRNTRSVDPSSFRTFGENGDITSLLEFAGQFFVVTDKSTGESNVPVDLFNKYIALTNLLNKVYTASYNGTDSYNIITSDFTVLDLIEYKPVITLNLDINPLQSGINLTINNLNSTPIKTASNFDISENGFATKIIQLYYDDTLNAFVYVGSGLVGSFIQSPLTQTPLGCVQCNGGSISNYPELQSLIGSIPNLANYSLRTAGSLISLNQLQNDAMQRMTGSFVTDNFISSPLVPSNVTSSGVLSGTVNITENKSVRSPLNDGDRKGLTIEFDNQGVVRTSTETRIKSYGVNTFLRVV